MQKKPLISCAMFRAIDVTLFVIAGALIMVLFNSTIQLSVVPSESMYPTLHIGSCLVSKVNCKNLNTDDIVIFTPFGTVPRPPIAYAVEVSKHCKQGGVLYIKRIVGCPGDTVEVRNGNLIRNGIVVRADYTAEPLMDYDMAEIQLGENEYFVMGDNRNNSKDSHIIGPIQKEQIVGKVVIHFEPIFK